MTLAVLGVLSVGIAAVLLGPCRFCKDGWMSRSSGRGTCSWHGGVDPE
jgi:hypothetical protein